MYVQQINQVLHLYAGFVLFCFVLQVLFTTPIDLCTSVTWDLGLTDQKVVSSLLAGFGGLKN